MSIAFNGMPIGVTASSKIILLTNIIFGFYVPTIIPTNENLAFLFNMIYGQISAGDIMDDALSGFFFIHSCV